MVDFGLKSSTIHTVLGSMIAIGNEKTLYLLEFTDCKKLDFEIERLCKKLKLQVVEGSCFSLDSIKKELKHYFKGQLKEFKTPVTLLGTVFQNQVWHALLNIPYGETRSYLDIASVIGRKNAFRAVANSNGANQLALIVPCHRVIQACGKLGGYAGGVAKKQWLLDHEKSFI